MTGPMRDQRSQTPDVIPAGEAAPIRTAAQWKRFLLGFTVLLLVLLGTAQVDGTGRYGLAILGVVLLAAFSIVVPLLVLLIPRRVLEHAGSCSAAGSLADIDSRAGPRRQLSVLGRPK